jgi:hypothetical protein
MKHFFIAGLLLTTCVVRSYSALPDPKGYYPDHPNIRTNFTSSSLPIVIIELNEKIAKKEEDRRTSATMKIIWNRTGEENKLTDPANNYNGLVGIKDRGSTSYSMSPKKPFALRLQNAAGDKNPQSILGMGSDDDWTLLAPYNDKSMIRDMLLYTLMEGALDYVPTGRYCELVLDGIYQGVYIMVARARHGDNRINVKKPTNATVAGMRGYHLEIDRQEYPYIQSCVLLRDLNNLNITNRTVYYMLKHPDLEDLSTVQWETIKQDVWDMEKAMTGDDWNDPLKGYRAFFDTTSAMNYIIAQELVRNVDGYRLSTPIYKDVNSNRQKFKFSIWDFNLCIGNADYISGWATEGWSYNNNQYADCSNPQFFKRMLQDEVFYSNLGKLWTSHRKNRFTDERIKVAIDSLVNLLKVPAVRNYVTWGYPLTPWPNYYYASSWDQELEYLRKWMNDRVKWLDSQWSAEVVNKVVNGTFEAAYSRSSGELNAMLSDWNTSGNVYLTTINMYEGNYGLSIQPNSFAWQFLTELPKGKYTFKCMVKTLGDPKATYWLQYYNLHSTGMREIIKNSTTYYQIEVKDIEVDNYFAEIRFTTGNSTGDIRLWVDNVEFIKQTENIDPTLIKDPQTTFNVKVNNMNSSIEIELPDFNRNTLIEVFDISGKTMYSGYAYAQVMKIDGLFVRNRFYIVHVGDVVKKIFFH